jgi:hypothetical protein
LDSLFNSLEALLKFVSHIQVGGGFNRSKLTL